MKITMKLDRPGSEMPGIGVQILAQFVGAMHGLAGVKLIQVIDGDDKLFLVAGDMNEVAKVDVPADAVGINGAGEKVELSELTKYRRMN